MKKKFLAMCGLLSVALLNISSVPFSVKADIDLAGTGHLVYSEHKWSFMASVVRVEEISALGSRGRAALLTYFKESSGNVGYAWALLDLQGYDFHAANGDVVAGQSVVVHILGDYVDERGINYDLCSDEPGDYCTILRLVEGAYPNSIDLYDLPASPGNKLIHLGSSSRNWWNGMLAWKIEVQ